MLDITPTQINDTPRVPSGIEIGLDIYTTWYNVISNHMIISKGYIQVIFFFIVFHLKW
jgi:hypothetical protein